MAKEDLTKVDPKRRGPVYSDGARAAVESKKGTKVFDGIKRAKLGTEKSPANVRVKTEKRKKELASVFEEHGWAYSIEVEPDEPEDTVDLDRLLDPPQPTVAEPKVGRNDPCPCGSGKKFKKCCGQ